MPRPKKNPDAPKKRRGRPLTPINWKLVDAYCAAQCTLGEIAVALDVSVDTIERAVKRDHGAKFAEYFALKRQAGLGKLRTRMFASAMAGNTRMMIWLSKNWMGFGERVELTGPNGGPIQTRESIAPVTEQEAADLYRQHLRG